ncbi:MULTISPECIES: glucosylglycerol-phosphate synthase [unclassified Xanthobacter]|uniref:glucosylglycerol-phosphate synthase n=1 Tax=unclassified Xanthobacter TaxID=2623496 RepID=UPI001F309952|nr:MULTISPECIES: glucosylglycerol-phosphate synthase [unclassified Xanthobacter]
MKSDLVIVYHRAPYEEVVEDGGIVLKEHKSPNGIVPTLKALIGRIDRAAWVAWKEAEDPANPPFERVVEISDSFGTYTVSRLPLTAEQVKSFYHVTSKEAFWPILHGFKERYNYDPVDWPTFRAVNWAFAEAAAQEASDDAVVWVHDYNLWLVPGYLRQLKPSVKIAFFHHTPFPGSDMFNVLPWRKEIVDSLLSCDAVGFHVPRYAQNFAAVAHSVAGARQISDMKTDPLMASEGTALNELFTPLALAMDGRTVRIDTNPVGVNLSYIEELAAAPAVAEKVEAIRAELGGRKLVLSVSRTDYTKGNIQQLEAFERLLNRRPELHNQVRLMLVSVGANRGMSVYEDVQQRIEELTGRINGTFGSFEWQPVSLISTAIPLAELVAYYRAADVASITPLADGLNLVASEFCAAQGEDGRGVLILSEFAGASVLLEGAIPVNPFSNAHMDKALDQALAMAEADAKGRMSLLRASARRFTLEDWAQTTLRGFEELKTPLAPLATAPAA